MAIPRITGLRIYGGIREVITNEMLFCMEPTLDFKTKEADTANQNSPRIRFGWSIPRITMGYALKKN
jgi:hypothetical protein